MRRRGDGRRFCREVFLWEMLSMAELFMRPTATRAFYSFEDVGLQGEIARHIHRLEAKAYLEHQPGGAKDRLYRLTEKGRLAALGGLDPTREWARPWDGRWRFFCFDMPANRSAERTRLWRALRNRRFGCLQGSLWISPDPAGQLRKELKGDRHPASLVVLEGAPCAGEKDGELIESAWDFEEIERRWADFDHRVKTGERSVKRGEFTRKDFRLWVEQTRDSWSRIVKVDPFLPLNLAPRGYPGEKTWRKKERAFRNIVEALSRRPLKAD